MRRVSPWEAQELIEREGYVYLDVRSVPEFEEAHPCGAYNVPFAEPCEGVLSPNPGFVREVAALFGRDAGIVVGCASGVRSLEAARLLAAHGFANLVEQRAGFSGVRDPFGRVRERGWREEGLPVSTGDELGRSHREIRARAQAQHR